MESEKVKVLFLIGTKIQNEKFIQVLEQLKTPDHIEYKIKASIEESEENPAWKDEEATVLGVFWVKPDVIEPALQKLPKIKWVHCFTAGVDSLMTPIIKEHPAPITNAKGAYAESLGEFVSFMMLWHLKKGQKWLDNKTKKHWGPEPIAMLSKKTLGIVGYGGIGQACAKVAKNGFGTRVLALKKRPERISDEAKANADEVLGMDKLDYLLAESDFVVNICPLTDETKDLYNKELFQKMKKTAVFMNIGRGPSVVEEDLIEALNSGEIAYSYLDVFRQEPYPSDGPLWDVENLYMSPHCADITEDILKLSVQVFDKNVRLLKEGKDLENVVDKSLGY